MQFAAQACAWRAGESEQQYRARLAPVATPGAAAAWQHGTAQRVHCLQLNAAVLHADAASASVAVTAVQVYPDPADAEGMRAYRWSGTVALAADGGAWTVTG
ncbi:hypothetical protein [Cumulibacter manganitolerans]|uniref:hypothetical protein n=1 Tax=Cumulibacter manganitolerans TaxID=1884992 RepID=UPI0012959243|nr:hypothetical protein [Cumulibacter manganitolerans]